MFSICVVAMHFDHARRFWHLFVRRKLRKLWVDSQKLENALGKTRTRKNSWLNFGSDPQHAEKLC